MVAPDLRWEIREGDCIDLMAAMPEASVDAIVTDPPYGLEFMGKDWDRLQGYTADTGFKDFTLPRQRQRNVKCPDCEKYIYDHPGRRCECGGIRRLQAHSMQEWHGSWAREALRVLKPGGHLLAFGGTRTYHRLACAIEDAGFEIRDSIAWQHMEEVFCACDSPMRGVRGAVSDVPATASSGEGADVLSSMQRGAEGAGVGEARAQGPIWVDGRESGQREGEDDGTAEPGLEGRCDVQANARKPQGREVRAVPVAGASDGPEGRLRDGAPAGNGDADRATVGADGGGASHRPRSAEQCGTELGAMAVEWIAQGGGAWPGCPRCGKPLAPPFFGGPLIWEYGSGFPKSLDVSKAIDKAAGAEREVVGINEDYLRRKPNGMQTPGATTYAYSERQQETDARITAPATCNAEQWDGWGTALKPAHEPIVVARKPLVGTVVANVLALGTGSMNIDGCRIGTATDSERGEGRGGEADPRVPRGRIGEASADRRYTERGATRFTLTPGPRGGDVAGRWPTNVVLDEDAAGMLDEQTGMLTSGKSDGFVGEYTANVYGKYARNEIRPETVYGDTGGASRFYYCAKASSAERSVGLSNGERSSHPTVKPIDLMRWLVRLVTPPGGLVLDPFAGSGTTGIAAVLEGFRFVGMEREPDYARIARARIAWWAENPQGLATDAILAAATERPDASQLDLFSV